MIVLLYYNTYTMNCQEKKRRKEKKVRFQAHRGVSTENPENTLEAVRAAVE